MGTETRSFGSWHLRGGRYEQHGLPVEFLSEFARYERLVVDVAKGLYKRRHATRQRVPRGFASSFSLRLSAVKTGSVVPVLEITPVEDSALFDEQATGIFDEARLLIQEALRSISVGSGIPPAFPQSALREFSRFGRSLQDDEVIEFDEGTQHAATYSQAIRRSIQEQARLDRFEVETLIMGQVTTLSAERGTFEFRLAKEGRTVNGRFSSDDVVADLRQYLDRSTMAPTVALNAVAIQSLDEEVLEIHDVLGVEPVLPAEWSERLAELQKLEAGWLDGRGQAVSRRVLRQAEALLLECLDAQIERPFIYPTEDGGVQFEWSTESGEVTAEITPQEQVELYAFSKVTDREEEATYEWRQLSEIAEFLLRGVAEYAR